MDTDRAAGIYVGVASVERVVYDVACCCLLGLLGNGPVYRAKRRPPRASANQAGWCCHSISTALDRRLTFENSQDIADGTMGSRIT